MSELFAPVCSLMVTKRRRFFWAAWWTAPPQRVPFRKPDASDGGEPSREAAIAAARRAAQLDLTVIDSEWARAWNRILRGQDPWPGGAAARGGSTREALPKERDGSELPMSIWTLLGVPASANAEELKLAFRKRALELHPDHGGEAEGFRKLVDAYAEARRRIAKPKAKRRT